MCSLSEYSKDAAIFAAIVTAKDLEGSDPVRAFLSVDRLLSALSDFLRQKIVTLGLGHRHDGQIVHVRNLYCHRKDTGHNSPTCKKIPTGKDCGYLLWTFG